MFADYLHPESFRDQTVKERHFLHRYKAKSDPRQLSDQDRLVSSQEKNTSPAQGSVRFRGIPNIEGSGNPSTENLRNFFQDFTTNLHE
jgi:hypothetical protein